MNPTEAEGSTGGLEVPGRRFAPLAWLTSLDRHSFKRAAIWAWRWRVLLLMNLFLISPVLLHELRLPAVSRLWQDIAARADKEGWPAIRFLAALAELELAERARRRVERHLVEARLPPGKTLDTFDFNAVPMLSCCCSAHPEAARAMSQPRSVGH